jgi:hypothetical protein
VSLTRRWDGEGARAQLRVWLGDEHLGKDGGSR